MQYYLTAIGTEDTLEVCDVLHLQEDHFEADLTPWVHSLVSKAQDISRDKPFASAILHENHWIPVLARPGANCHLVTTPEGSKLLSDGVVDLDVPIQSKVMHSAFAADCGFQAFAWLLGQAQQSEPEVLTPKQAEGWRHLFWKYLFGTDAHATIIDALAIGGMLHDNHMLTQLSDLLKQHGVWSDRVFDRANVVMQKLGLSQVRSIMTSKKPWADLKAAANHQQPVLKLVMADELEYQIQQRAQSNRAFGKKPAKGRGPPTQPAQITAADLQVPPGVFRQQDGTKLAAIPASQIGPHARGVVLVDQHDCEATLKIARPVSSYGLAVLVLANPNNAANHVQEPIKFPALCPATQEAILVSGYMYQLGKIEVVRDDPAQKVAVEAQPADAIRCVVYQDQAQALWKSMTAHPVRTIFEAAGVGQNGTVIDVWDRQWVTHRYERCKQSAADMFIFLFRISADLTADILSRSGDQGIFFEPRSPCGRKPSVDYHVTWIPSFSLQDVRLACQTAEHQTSVARHGMRYGIRSDAMNAQAIHAKHRPDIPLLLGAQKTQYTVGPLPYATSREALCKLLRAWDWDAKPLQPRGRATDGSGITWGVLAVEDPSHWVYTLQHGDVLISKVIAPKAVEAPVQPNIIASKKTMQHLQNRGEDPWLTQPDPWQPSSSHAPSTRSQSSSTTVSSAQLAHIEANVEKKVLQVLQSKLPTQDVDVAMDPTHHDARLDALEAQMQQLQQGQIAQEQRVGQIQQQLDNQPQIFGTMLDKALDQKLQAQMDRIDMLLRKRKSDEWQMASPQHRQSSLPFRHVQPKPHLPQFCPDPISHKPIRLFRAGIVQLLMLFALAFRIGEAAQPGPIFGNFNPTGLNSKSSDLHSLPMGVYAVQETHLSSMGIPKFKQELKWHQSPYNMVHGHPAPVKGTSVRAIGGKATGVAILSSYPCRMLQHDWTEQQYRTSRCLVAATHVQDNWVTLGTVYGFAERSSTIEVQQQTNSLLQGLTSRVVDGATGMRIISGDWNVEREHIPQADYWESQGWIDIQTLARQRWHRPCHSTCKRTTIKDFMYISPEVVPYVHDVWVQWEVFPDHGVLILELADFAKPRPIPVWPKAKPIHWPDQCIPWICEVQPHSDMDVWYEALMQDLEKYADHVMQNQSKPLLTAHQKGRASTKEVRWMLPHQAPLKPNRSGDIQVTLPASTLQHSRWTRQVRRFQHYVRLVEHFSCTQTQVTHQHNLWRRITVAPGFADNFASWWNQLPAKSHLAPQTYPNCPPGFVTADAMFQDLCTAYHDLEAQIRQARVQLAKDRRIRDPHLIYRDLRKACAEPVQTLVASKTLAIRDRLECPHNQTRLRLAEPFPPGCGEIAVDGVLVRPVVIHPHCLQLDSSVADQLGHQVICPQLVGDVEEILRAFADEWTPRWNVQPAWPDSHWNAIVDFAKVALPTAHGDFPPITRDIWTQTLQSKKKRSAVGPDGLSRADLLHMPDSILDGLLALFSAVENGNPWPTQTIVGLVAALAKHPEARRTTEYRPITIFSLAYRVWGSIRSRQCLTLVSKIAPHTMMGNMPKKSAKHVWFHVQEAIEYSTHHGTEISGAVIDIVKCFNALPRRPLLAIANHIGIPLTVTGPWASALQAMTRRFTVRQAVGPALPSNNGMPEGDGERGGNGHMQLGPWRVDHSSVSQVSGVDLCR